MKEDIKKFFTGMGIKEKDHVLLHSSFRKIKNIFNETSIENFITNLQEIITPEGSLILPAFTYCFKKRNIEYEIFDRCSSPAKTGAVSDVFRSMPGVIRTSSPTHSFALWGCAAQKISYKNSPVSPLGKESVLEWLAQTENSWVLMAGVNFSSFSFGHYLEIIADVPWKGFSPWEYLSVEPVGVSTEGEIALKEIPGCAKSFVHFEDYLLSENIIEKVIINNSVFYYFPVKQMIEYGKEYFTNNRDNLLCPKGVCKPCDARHQFLEKFNNEKI